MSKAAFFNLPAHGHVNPSLAVVTELVKQGESAVYYNTDDFRAAIEATGAEFRSYASLDAPTPYLAPGADALQVARSGFGLAAALLETSIDILPGMLGCLEKHPVDYIIHDSACAWGRFAAEILGLPSVASHTMFALDRELFFPGNWWDRLWAISAAVFRQYPAFQRIGKARRELASRYGLKSTRVIDVLSNRAPLNLVYTARELQPRPELFGDTYHFVGPSLTQRGDEGDFAGILGDEPVIYVSLGTIFNQSLSFYRTCFEALGGRPQKIVMSVGRNTDISHLGSIPPNFVVRNWVPQLLVLSRAALFLTRAGMNSVNESLFHGVPMLLFPEIDEQKLVAKQVSDLGAGLTLSERNLQSDKLRRETDHVLQTARFRDAAKWLGSCLRNAGGPARAAELILQSQVKRHSQSA